MWKLSTKPRTMRVTKALIREFVEMDPAPHDRPLSERRLQVYSKMFAAGGFRPVTWAKAVCRETGGVYRINGKHTSILLSGLAELPDFYVTIEEYSCDTLEDVAKLYATFDSRVMVRTANDINQNFAATVPELAEIGSRIINAAVAGMAYYTWQGGISTTQAAERAELLLEHSDFVLWLAGILSGRAAQTINPLFRQAVVASMFATWSKVKAASAEFWQAVRDETGTEPGLPDRKLAKYLQTHGCDRSRGASVRANASTREQYVKCLHAWNAWRKGETTNLNYYPDKDVPAVR